MSKKVEQKIAEPSKNEVYIFISDEGSCGKSTAAIAITEYLRNNGQDFDLYLCDANHKATLSRFGLRDSTGELLPMDQQTPNGCAFFNIRTEGSQFINYLVGGAKKKGFDFPADSIDQLPAIFKSIPMFLSAFEKTKSRLNFVVPANNDGKSFQSAKKLYNMFVGINPNVEVRFIFIYNHTLMKDVAKTVGAFATDSDIEAMRNAGLVIDGHIKADLTEKFTIMIDEAARDGKSWHGMQDMFLFNEIIMEAFLNDYDAIAKQL